MIETLSTLDRGNIGLDPNRLNRGQVIHFKGQKDGLTHLGSKTCETFRTDNQNVENVVVENAVFCDWFEMTLLTENMAILDSKKGHIQISEGLFLEHKEGKTSHYYNVWNVIYLGELYATLLSHPSKNYIKPNQLQIKVNNEHLYTHGWLDSFKDILDLSGWIKLSNTRMDIAIDGKGGDNARSLAQRHLKGSVISRKGKAIMTVRYSSSKDIKSFHVGSPKSEKSATIYNKSDDIAKKDKQYIQDAWKRNNLKGTGDTKRIEVRMKAKIANSYEWERFDDPAYLATIMRTECKNWFEFYYTGKDKNRHRTYKTKSMEWIDWDTISGELLPKNRAVAKSGIHRAKRIIKDSLYMKYVEDKAIDDRLISALKVDYVLHKWLDDRIDHWLKEWDRLKMYQNINSN